MGRPPGSRNRPKDTTATKTPAKKRGRKTKAKPAETRETSSASSGAASVNSGFKKPTADQVKKLVKSLVSMGNDSRAISTAVGEKVAKAVETQHFDKKALNIVKSLYQMSINRPEAFAITLPHLLAYIDDLGLDKVANEARGMDLEGDDEVEEEIGDEAETEQAPTTNRGLRVVPGANAPTGDSEVPAAPKDEQAA